MNAIWFQCTLMDVSARFRGRPTLINTRPVMGPTILTPSDVITLGTSSVQLMFLPPDGTASPDAKTSRKTWAAPSLVCPEGNSRLSAPAAVPEKKCTQPAGVAHTMSKLDDDKVCVVKQINLELFSFVVFG